MVPDRETESVKVDKFYVAHCMESGANYPGCKASALWRMAATKNGSNVIVATMSLCSHVPAVYGSGKEFNVLEALDVSTSTRQNAAVPTPRTLNPQP